MRVHAGEISIPDPNSNFDQTSDLPRASTFMGEQAKETIVVLERTTSGWIYTVLDIMQPVSLL